LESEERNLMGEVRSLEARLEVISGRLREINQAKADQGERENKIAGLLDSPRYKELLARHKEYEEYRKLLLGEAS
ncbi:MAG: hypothetical protein KGJ35_02995, partial [Patescibacteria group bacterium]|nr:hypothetical protein [Patescibacteria group bacterium]